MSLHIRLITQTIYDDAPEPDGFPRGRCSLLEPLSSRLWKRLVTLLAASFRWERERYVGAVFVGDTLFSRALLKN